MIPVNEPLLLEDDIRYVDECMRTGWISSSGRFIDELENRWARFCERRFGVAVSNGTVALQLAVACLDMKPGDEVVMPAFTMMSCALAVIYNGGTPVLVDADPDTWCMDVDQVAARIGPRTRALMPVHIYGHPVDMDPILDLAERHKLAVVEDAAEAHGARYLSRRGSREEWRPCGSLGDMSCFSFYANKLVTTGEGGMVLTDDSRLAERARSLRNLSFGRKQRFRHESLGYNFRLTNLQAALGVAQIERIADLVARKRRMGERYLEALRGVRGVQLPIEAPWARSVYWMFGMVVSEETGVDATHVAEQLKQREVDTRPFFLGMHEQPALRDRGLFRGETYPVTERLGRQGLYLPSGLALSDDQMDHVTNAVLEVMSDGVTLEAPPISQ